MNNKKTFFTDSEHYAESFEDCEYTQEDIDEIEILMATISIDMLERILDNIQAKRKLNENKDA